jgi:hypothetical protein
MFERFENYDSFIADVYLENIYIRIPRRGLSRR